MKKAIKYLWLVVPALLTISLTGCQEEAENNQEQTNRFVGKWLVENYIIDYDAYLYDTLGVQIGATGEYYENEGARPISFTLYDNYTGISLDSTFHNNGSAGITTTSFKWIDNEDKFVLIYKNTYEEDAVDTFNIVSFEENSAKFEQTVQNETPWLMRDSIFDSIVVDSLIEVKEYNYTVIETLSRTISLKRE